MQTSFFHVCDSLQGIPLQSLTLCAKIKRYGENLFMGGYTTQKGCTNCLSGE